jgi:hypothetical protein
MRLTPSDAEFTTSPLRTTRTLGRDTVDEVVHLPAWVIQIRPPMTFSKVQALGGTIVLFVAVYIPAFAAVSLSRPPIQIAIPLIIGVSLAIALALIFAHSSAGWHFRIWLQHS